MFRVCAVHCRREEASLVRVKCTGTVYFGCEACVIESVRYSVFDGAALGLGTMNQRQ